MPTAINAEQEIQEMPVVEKPKSVFGFKIGADPEFNVFFGDVRVHAEKAMKLYMDKLNLETRTTMGYFVPDAGEIGWDGHASTGEIRPLPSNDPEEITDKIGKLIETLNSVMPNFDFTTLSLGAPTGGHIHLDLPAEIKNNGRSYNRTLKLLTTFLMPVIASEHTISAPSRFIGGQYGNIENFRQNSGENSQLTLEIRGPSAEWISNRKVCHATLAYIGVIWHEILKNGSTLIKNETAFKNGSQADAIQKIFLSDYKPVKNAVLESIKNWVTSFELYPNFKKECDFILNPEAVFESKEKTGWNLLTGWVDGNKKIAPSKRMLLTDKQLTSKLKDVNMEFVKQTFAVSYNDDYNIAHYSNAISERIAAFNWALKNEYFLFGLKKGQPDPQFLASRLDKDAFFNVSTGTTKEDVLDITLRMGERFKSSINGQGIKVNPKNGQTHNSIENGILIGIPYELRMTKDTRPLIEFIWELEGGKLPEKKLAEFRFSSNKKKEEKTTDEILAENGAVTDNTGSSTSFNLPENLHDDVWNRTNNNRN